MHYESPEEVGARVGRAIAHTVLTEDVEDCDWPGLVGEDGDQFTGAGIDFGTPEWDVAERAAEAAYHAAIRRCT